MRELTVVFCPEDKPLDVKFLSETGDILDVSFLGRDGSIPGQAELYNGKYVVTPKVKDDVVLPTQNKRMEQNITVQKIPQFFVSNAEGGTTLIIGEEYYA